MFSRWYTAITPGIFFASSVSRRVIAPFEIVAETGHAYSRPGKWWSEAYIAEPLTLSGPSIRGVATPITFDSVTRSIVLSLGDLTRLAHRVHQAALCQLYFEPVLALRLRAVKRCLGCG